MYVQLYNNTNTGQAVGNMCTEVVKGRQMVKLGNTIPYSCCMYHHISPAQNSLPRIRSRAISEAT